MKIELQILLGLNCNFKCDHCLNSSGPGLRDYDISESDITVLIDNIRKHDTVKMISFSGGEPLLYIKQIEEIVFEVRKVNPNIKFSITTNGSLLSKNLQTIKELKIDFCMLSYDREHATFLTGDEFMRAMELSKEIFASFEVNVTQNDESPHLGPIKDYLLKNNIKVNFNYKIESGRFSEKSAAAKTFNFIKCPNVNDDSSKFKTSYIAKRGFTICCGPVVFDSIQNKETVFFDGLDELKENLLVQFLEKAKVVPLLNSGRTDCDKCKATLKGLKPEDIKQFVSGKQSVVSEWTTDSLNRQNQLFYPKFVKKVAVGSFSQPNFQFKRSIDLVKEEGDNLPHGEIDEFSRFTIETFYKIHTRYYSTSDIQRFKNDQKIFFNLKNKYVKHRKDGELVGFLAVCLFEKHPIFDTKTWHVGYWGIRNAVAKPDRDAIKSDWANLLSKLNEDAIVGANIDYFNVAADKMSEKFNFQTQCVRLDART